MAYRAFGEELENTGTGTAPKYSYTGKELDSSGLMYYGARYYDPALARFITPDTVYDVGPQGLNRYSYALNNPIRYNDPSGHMSNPFEVLFRGLHDPPVGELVGNLMRDEAEATAETVMHQITPPEQDAGVVEGSFPIWGDGKDSYLAFKEGKILYGMLYGIMALNDVADGGVSPEDAAKAGIQGGRGLAEKATKSLPEFVSPRGFKSLDQFRSAMDELDSVLRGHGIDDASFLFRGSSTTGLSKNPKKPGKWFSAKSDIDLSIQSRKLTSMLRSGGAISSRNVPGLFLPKKMRRILPADLMDELAGWNERWVSRINAKDIEPAVSDPDLVLYDITDIRYPINN